MMATLRRSARVFTAALVRAALRRRPGAASAARQREPESSPVARLALDADRAAHLGHQLAANVEPQAGRVVVLGQAGEAFEELVAVAFGDARALVGDRDDDL